MNKPRGRTKSAKSARPIVASRRAKPAAARKAKPTTPIGQTKSFVPTKSISSAKLASAKPASHSSRTPAKPASRTPKPAASAKSKLASATSSSPSSRTPGKLASAKPAKPAKPASAKPAKPSSRTPAKPSSRTAKPAASGKSKLASATSAKPTSAASAKSKLASATSTKPTSAASATSKLASAASVKPTSAASAASATSKLASAASAASKLASATSAKSKLASVTSAASAKSTEPGEAAELDAPLAAAASEDAAVDADEPTRAAQIATLATTRAHVIGADGAPVQLGSITVPSGTLAIFDIGLMGYLPRAALDPMLICAPVPSDRALPVIGTRVGKGRFAECWDHVAIALTEPGSRREVAHARKLGKAAVDFSRLILMDRAAIDHWQHEDSLDQLADFVFWGRDEAQLGKALGARRLPDTQHWGWTNLPVGDAEALADRAAQLKADHKWLLATDLRPHSHHFDVLAAARASPSGAGVLEVAGARVMVFFTSWGDGVFPVYLDVDQDQQPVQVRIQLAAVEPAAKPG